MGTEFVNNDLLLVLATIKNNNILGLKSNQIIALISPNANRVSFASPSITITINNIAIGKPHSYLTPSTSTIHAF